MPQMSGPELVERLKVDAPRAEGVFLSGYSAETVARAVAAGRSAFLQKPFDDVSLLQGIRSLVDASQHAR